MGWDWWNEPKSSKMGENDEYIMEIMLNLQPRAIHSDSSSSDCGSSSSGYGSPGGTPLASPQSNHLFSSCEISLVEHSNYFFTKRLWEIPRSVGWKALNSSYSLLIRVGVFPFPLLPPFSQISSRMHGEYVCVQRNMKRVRWDAFGNGSQRV